MKIAVLGASGMLGSMLVDYLSQSFEVVATVRDYKYVDLLHNVVWRHFDVRNPQFRVIKDCDWVINAIGAIPQKCSDINLMYEINASFPHRLSLRANKIIHVTTDCVYRGDKGNYTEKDAHDDMMGYGDTKWMGEVKDKNVINLRCSLIGPEPHGNYSLLGWFLSQPKNTVIQGYSNYLWNGITTLHFAKICRGIIESSIPVSNIQHVIPLDGMCKYELLNHFGTYFNRPDIMINPVEHSQSINRTLATTNPEMNTTLWRSAGYSEIPSVEHMVDELAEHVKVKKCLIGSSEAV